MKCRVFFILCAIAASGALVAQPAPNADWLGVWQGELDGQPSVVLTLADDGGTVGGTVVLNVIQKENGQAHIAGIEPHVLLNPHIDGETLAFQFRKLNGDLADFTVQRTATGEAKIHCLNCGSGAPTVNIVRAQ